MVEGPHFWLMTQAPNVFCFQNLKEVDKIGTLEERCWERTHNTYMLMLLQDICIHTQSVEIDIAIITFTFWGGEGGGGRFCFH